MSEPTTLPAATLPDPPDPYSIRVNCTLEGRYAEYLRHWTGAGLKHGEVLRRLIDGALAIDLRQAGPEIDRALHHAKAELAEVMMLIPGKSELKAKLQTAVEAVGRAHVRVRQVQTV